MRGQRGFVLALTLWILAAVAVVVGLTTVWALEMVRDAANGRAQLEAELAMLGTRDTLLYLGATRERTLGGLQPEVQSEEARALRSLDDLGALRRDARGGELLLDGTAYRGLDATTFALQDSAGLLSLVAPSAVDLDRFLDWAGVAREDIPPLRDALLDYADSDALRSLHGAEAREYERESQPAPPNRRLLLPAEAMRVMGWAELPDSLHEALAEGTTTFYAGAVNLNTVPSDLLPVWVPGCPSACELLETRRAAQPFGNASEVESLLGVRLPGDEMVDYRFLSDNTLRLTLWSRSGLAWRMHVRFTPLADQVGPWSILAAYPISAPGTDATAQSTGSDLFADAPPGRS